MGNRYASNKIAIAICDRCGFRFRLRELRPLTIKTKQVNMLVCQECWEPDQPQLQLGMYPVYDPQAIRNPRPDAPSYYVPAPGGDGGSRVIEWGFNPVGMARWFDAALTPNHLVGFAVVGSVTVS